MNHYTHLYESTVIDVNCIRSMINLLLEACIRYPPYIVAYCKRVHYTTDSLVWGSLRLAPISHAIHHHLFSNLSPFCSPVKEKGKQWRMKELTMVHWINLKLEQICGSTLIFCIVRKTGPILLLLVGLTAGSQAGWKESPWYIGLILNRNRSVLAYRYSVFWEKLALSFYY